MYQEAYTEASALDLPLLTLILFVAIFLVVVVAVWLRGKDDPKHSYLALLPLEDDDVQP